MNVYFLRHGIAVEPAEWKGRDFDRPLTGKGIARMEREACAIAELLPDLDAIVTSPLLRARQTAEIVAERLERGKPIEDERLGVGFGIDLFSAVLDAHRDAGEVLLVGHEPSMSVTVGRLVGAAHVEIKKGALAGVTLADAASTAGVLICLIPPKVLTALGKH